MDFCRKLLYFIWTSQVVNAFYAYLPPSKKRQIYFFSNKTFSRTQTPYYTSNHTYENECITTLHLSNNGMKVVVIEKTGNKSVTCHFFNEEPKMVSNVHSKYIVLKENHCSRTCDTLKHTNLCGPCKCYDACSPTARRQHLCDCTHDVPSRSGCKMHHEKGFNKSGRYLIDPDNQGSFPVYCEMEMEFKSNMELTCEKVTRKSYIVVREIVREKTSTFSDCYADVLYSIKHNSKKYNSVSHHYRGKKECFGVIAGPLKPHANVNSCKLQLIPNPPVKAPEISRSIQMLVRYDLENMEFWDRSMEDYETGFGSMDMWIGLNNLHRITTAFKTDMHVLMVSRGFHDLVTTTYEDIHIKSKSEGYLLTYVRLNHHGARIKDWEFQTDRLKESSGEIFTQCNGHNWWKICSGGIYTPTSTDKYTIGFGSDVRDFESIVFLLTTSDLK